MVQKSPTLQVHITQDREAAYICIVFLVRVFMPRDGKRGEKRELWNDLSIVPNEIMIRKRRRERGKCG